MEIISLKTNARKMLQNKKDFLLTDTHWTGALSRMLIFTDFFIYKIFFIHIPTTLREFS